MRLPLAFAFLSGSSTLRITAIACAMFTDSIDGYIARRSHSTSKFGAILDPAMDKFFVYFGLSVLLLENKLLPWQSLAMVSRDVFLMIFAMYLLSKKSLRGYEYRAIRWGKVSTALQFIVLIGLCMNITFPTSIYLIFVAFGCFAFTELVMRMRVS
jgi:CDP-diacylglycerol--glycerol-3-phosphate 3-phosphatidyltransferase